MRLQIGEKEWEVVEPLHDYPSSLSKVLRVQHVDEHAVTTKAVAKIRKALMPLKYFANECRITRVLGEAFPGCFPPVHEVFERAQLRDGDFTEETDEGMLLEDIPGKTLLELLPQTGVMNIKDTLHYGIGTALALKKVHDLGFVDRDVKPSNVIVGPRGMGVCLLDFGHAISRAGDFLTKPGTAVGSIGYMAPEMCIGDQRYLTDPRLDIFGLGMMLYTLHVYPHVMGEFVGCLQDYYEFLGDNCHKGGPLPDPNGTNSPLLPAINRMTAFWPKDRVQSAAEAYFLLRDLEDTLT